MTGMTISRAAMVCDGRLCGGGDFGAELGSVVIDSRAVSAGDFFVAYKGERVDGHDYISAAFDRGAVCCLAQRAPEGETRPIILVPDVQAALEELKEKNKGSDVEAIKAATDKVQKAFYAISEKLYKNAAPQDGAPTDGGAAGSAGNAGGNGGDDVVDADFEEVND